MQNNDKFYSLLKFILNLYNLALRKNFKLEEKLNIQKKKLIQLVSSLNLSYLRKKILLLLEDRKFRSSQFVFKSNRII